MRASAGLVVIFAAGTGCRASDPVASAAPVDAGHVVANTPPVLDAALGQADPEARALSLCAWYEDHRPPAARGDASAIADFSRCTIDLPSGGAWALDVTDVTTPAPDAWSARIAGVRLDWGADGGAPTVQRLPLDPWANEQSCGGGRVCSTAIEEIREMWLSPAGDIDGDGRPDAELRGTIVSHVCADGAGSNADDVRRETRVVFGVKPRGLALILPRTQRRALAP